MKTLPMNRKTVSCVKTNRGVIMAYRPVTLSEPAYRWLQRHPWVSDLKIINTVMFAGKDAIVVGSDDGADICRIQMRVRRNGGFANIFIEYVELPSERKVLKIHSQSIKYRTMRR